MSEASVVEIEKLKAVDIFSNLSGDALRELAAVAVVRRVRLGEKILEDGQANDSMFVIIKGEVRISKHIQGIGEEALAILKSGSYFGEMGLIDGAPASATVWANRTCVLYVLNRQSLSDLMKGNQKLSVELLWSFVHTLSVRLRKANSKLTFLSAAGKF